MRIVLSPQTYEIRPAEAGFAHEYGGFSARAQGQESRLNRPETCPSERKILAVDGGKLVHALTKIVFPNFPSPIKALTLDEIPRCRYRRDVAVATFTDP